MNVNGNRVWYLQIRFCSEKSDAKLKTGVFIGPEIRHLIKDLSLFDASLKKNVNQPEEVNQTFKMFQIIFNLARKLLRFLLNLSKQNP